MGLVQWLTQRSLIPGEPAVDRTRKELVAPMYCILGGIVALWLFSLLPTVGGYDRDVEVARAVVSRFALLLTLPLLPAGVYIVYTRRITQALCEVPMVLAGAGVVLTDVSHLLYGVPSAISLNVICLDLLLLCSCSDNATKVVLVMTGAWITARAVLEREDIAGEGCDMPARFSFTYFAYIVSAFTTRMLVLVVDFRLTRGFARSMHEQRAVVEAAVRVCEDAAVLLSRYETDATKALLDGPDGEQLSERLRCALLQVVGNLAAYRPYIPQSCLAAAAGDVSATPTVSTEGSPRPASSASTAEPRMDSGASLGCESNNKEGAVRGLTAVVRARKVSVVAVNSISFLDQIRDRGHAAQAAVHREVEAFSCDVAAEHGVVDLVSGDHLFANFNASRMCIAHRLSAARVAWGSGLGVSPSAAPSSFAAPSGRSACACSGVVLCGDFGTAELLRFMMLGSVPNQLQCLERVAAQLPAVLVDEAVGADVDSCFFTVLLERLRYRKRGPQPFYVWRLAGLRRQPSADEWMYELQRLGTNPFEAWNRSLRVWLQFGEPVAAQDTVPHGADGAATSAPRQQTVLVEAGVVGATVALTTRMHARLSFPNVEAPEPAELNDVWRVE
eukprot:TRINITY_DN3734_c0_g1_i1.p1 TRINITY_DN3734_c0_g1~~TRINITY_DN3734_c0_g1_i1.p1  ORF type:complete len:624 (+),score=176.19 TRINITY_DN3734_c0_g1_i1:27-1874(+)